MEEQLNSYAVQTSHYTEKIKSTPKWEIAGVFADKGISRPGEKNYMATAGIQTEPSKSSRIRRQSCEESIMPI